MMVMMMMMVMLYVCHRGAFWLGPFVTMIYQMCRSDLVRFLVIYGVFMSGFAQGSIPEFLSIATVKHLTMETVNV